MILGLILIFLCIRSYEQAENFTLDSETFDTYLESHYPMMIMFYTPWCEKCKELAPEFIKAGELGIKHDPPFYLASLDASKQKNISQKYEISQVPSIILLRKGREPIFVDNLIEAERYIEFIENKILPPSLNLKTKEEVDKVIKTDQTIVIFGGDQNSIEFKSYYEVASLFEEVTYYHTSYEILNNIIKKKGKGSPLLVLFKRFDEKIDIFNDKYELKPIIRFIDTNYLPHVLELNQKNIDAVFNKGKEAMFLFINKSSPGSDYVIKSFKKFANNNKNQLAFFLTGVSDGDEIKVAEYLRVSPDDLPRLEIYRPTKPDLARYIYGKKNLDYNSFDEFLYDYRSGKIERNFRSEDIPESQDSVVTKIVGKTWNDLVLKSKKDVLVKFYMPKCDPCLKLDPIYKEVAEKMKKYSDNITFAEIDIHNNDIPDANIKTVPHIRLYPSKSKTNPFELPYNGSKSTESIMSFIKEKASFRIHDTLNDLESSKITDL